DVVAHARQVTHATTTYKHDGVLLQIVTLAWDVGRDLDAIGKPNARHFAKGGVGLFRRHDLDLQADTLFLRAAVQSGMLGLTILLAACLANQLINRRHSQLS